MDAVTGNELRRPKMYYFGKELKKNLVLHKYLKTAITSEALVRVQIYEASAKMA